MDNRGKRKEEIGIVISDKAQKTIVVKVYRVASHSKYSKTVRQFSKFKVHDEKNEAKAGDRVSISETRPISKDKRWRLVKVLNKANL